MSYIEQLRRYVSMSSCGEEMRVPLQIKIVPIDGNETQSGGAPMSSDRTHINAIQCTQQHIEQ